MNKNQISPEQLAEHPLLVVLMLLGTCIAFTLVVGALATWIMLGRRWNRGEPILPVQPWMPRVWGFVDLVFVAVAAIFFQVAGIHAARHLFGVKLGPDMVAEQLPLSAMACVGAGNLLAVLIGVWWIVQRHRASLDHLGFRFQHLPRETTLGVVAAFGSLPIVWTLMAIVTVGAKTEYEHPLLTQMLENSTLSSFLLGSFSAVIAAPLAEEFLFRVILQGWLQSIVRNLTDHAWFWGDFSGFQPRYIPEQSAAEPRGSESSAGCTDAQGFEEASHQFADRGNAVGSFETFRLDASGSRQRTTEANLYATSAELAAGGHASAANAHFVPPVWPSFVSGVLFGLAHWGYGMSFVPLIFLGVVLGLLYRATHSIFPGLIVHLILNSLSMLVLAMSIVAKQAGIE